MRIGIVTFWQTTDNYGQVLQAYALQKYLLLNGHEPFFIRYNFIERKLHKPLWKRLLKKVLVFPEIKRLQREKRERYNIEKDKKSNAERLFSEFRKTHFIFSEKSYNTLQELRTDSPKADCYIAGSDQVWAQLLNIDDNKVFFLDFGPKRILRISYAASFAMMTYPPTLCKRLKKQLSHFNAISVREDSGVEICASVGVKAQKVLDPTLLIDKQNYQGLISSISRKEKSYVYIYSLNIESPKDIGWNKIKKYADCHNWNVIVTSSSGYITGDGVWNNEKVQLEKATIEEWLSNIVHSNLFVTTSFHGVVFAIILQKDFVYVPLKGKYAKGNNRALNLLSSLNLSERVYSEDNSFERVIENLIDWDVVSRLLQKERKISEDFLFNCLS